MYRKILSILIIVLFSSPLWVAGNQKNIPGVVQFDFCGISIQLRNDCKEPIAFSSPFNVQTVQQFYNKALDLELQSVADQLLEYKKRYRLEDWFFYQLIRRTAAMLSPKKDNYERYTLYKWFLLQQSGYNASIRVSGEYMLLYIQSADNIYNIPSRIYNGNAYVCLNYHDYGNIDFTQIQFNDVVISEKKPYKNFSYTINHIPDFNLQQYQEQELQFNYNNYNYQFKIKVNPEIKNIFANYPVMDYQAYFNIPLSNETYQSLIPALKHQLKKMSVKSGVDYLMHFTRYAFIFQTDSKQFGGEKRLSPEQTLLYKESDCDDRAALFFFLVKEIYNLPMLVLAYPQHVTIAVQFDKAPGKPIVYNGERYYICEPTSQKRDLGLGEQLPELKNVAYEVAYAYQPSGKHQ